MATFEEDLVKIAGVLSAHVVGEDAPTEIHVVATPERTPKQVVRDVQSLAAAKFGISIDHRIVSIVQLDEVEEQREGAKGLEEELRAIDEDAMRPLVDRIVFANKGNSGWVKVALRWPDGDMTEGAEVVGATRESRARGAARAVHRALETWLSKRNAVLDIEHVLIQKLGSTDSVTVNAVMHEEGQSISLVGSAIIHDDTATAAVHATLQGLNRKLRARAVT